MADELAMSSSPARSPSYNGDPELDQGRKLSFASVLSIAAPSAKVIVVGDSDHHNAGVRGIMGRTENLEAAYSAGIRHIVAETGLSVQEDIDAYRSGRLTKDELYTTLHDKLSTTQGNSTGQWTRQLVEMADFAKKTGMQAHIDYTGYEPVESTAKPGSDQHYRETTAESKRRFDDRPVAERFNGMEGRILMQVGHIHFSLDNGSREAVQGGMIKVDVYASRADYLKNQSLRHNLNSEIGAHALKPELVYFQDTGTVHTTETTPPDLKARIAGAAPALKEEFKPTPAPALAPNPAP